MKVAVYTICRDELANVVRWLDCCADADFVTVADTGSKDGTADMFRNAFERVPGRSVHQVSIDPWRFDDAHNAALALVPIEADVCIPLHMDERLMPGWRDELEAGWIEGTTKCFYTYVFAHNPDGSPALEFLQNRIHARKGYRWKYPDHEGVYPYMLPERTVTIPKLRIEQWQDRGKDRSMILARLAMGVQENPNDSRMAHYFGRELMYHGYYRQALIHLQRYNTLPGGFPYEQAANADCIANCYRNLDRSKD